MEYDGTWGAASRNALRSFNERTRSVGEIDRPTPEALEAVQGHKDRVCPAACEPGTELHGARCVAVPKPQDRSRHAARPPARSLRTPHQVEPAHEIRAPAQPVVRDCVHVSFPQCSRGFGG
jgi:hypothetical protein